MVKLNYVFSVNIVSSSHICVACSGGKRKNTDIGQHGEYPVCIVRRSRIRNLEPVSVAPVALQIVLGRAREIDEAGAGMPDVGFPKGGVVVVVL